MTMTTITTEKIEELISKLHRFYGHEHWVTVKGIKQPSSFDMSRHPLISQAIKMLRAMVPQPQEFDSRYAELEREHLGDAEKGTGIYHPGNRALEPQWQATMICASCGADRFKEDCKGLRQNCSLRGVAQCSQSKKAFTLPELPDATFLGGDPDYGDDVYGFTANQMGAYGRQCYDAGRAFQKPQGQALPELPGRDEVHHYYWENPVNGRMFYKHASHWSTGPDRAKPLFTADQMHEYARAYASQLALPAGPVPEGYRLVPVRPTRDMLIEAGFERGDGEEQWEAMLAASPSPAVAQHSDDIAVDRFAAAMKEKLKLAREKGRGGWEQCSQDALSRMLREHVEKGDPRDVANFCMMLWNNGVGIAAVAQPVADERDAYEQWVAGKYEDEFDWFDIWQAGASYARAALCPPAEEGGKS